MMIKCKHNYIGEKFNHLTVIKQVEDFISPVGKHRRRPQFLCQCDCKQDNPNKIVVRLDSLKNGHTSSCGCIKLCKTLELCENKRKPIKDSPYLELHLVDEKHMPYGKCKASNSDNYFYFSMCDYEIIKDYCWYENVKQPSDYHSLVTSINGIPLAMHRILGMFNPDHINRNPLDNRRENLDNNVSKSIQSQNRGLQINNTSGCKGVHWVKKDNRWIAQIKKDRKTIYLGQYKSKSDAIIARLNAEKIYFDKRSWQIELMERFNV